MADAEVKGKDGVAATPAETKEDVKVENKGENKGSGGGKRREKKEKKPVVKKEKESNEKVTFSAKKNEDFNEWFEQIVRFAGIMDKRYPVKVGLAVAVCRREREARG